MKSPLPPPKIDKQARLSFVLMVVIGFAITLFLIFAQDERKLTSWEIALGFSSGVIYLLLGLNSNLIIDRLPTGWAEGLFFSVQCVLIFVIGYVLGTGATWLIGLPLVGFAVEMLTSRWQWLVYIAVIAVLILPIGLRHGSWTGALINIATIGAAVFFVAVFARLRLNEQQARERAERLMIDLEAANKQLAVYATQAEELAMTQERNRLAREIHDSLGHTLTIVNVQIEAAKVVMESEPERASDALKKAQDMTLKALRQVRESVASLRESPVSNRPLEEAIRPLLEEAQSAGIITEFKIVGNPYTLENKVALSLYRALQEGLTNVCKHASASRVDVLLAYQPNQVNLEIKDNGVGTTETAGGFGLLGIRERMQLLGGSLEIQTGMGKGFSLLVTIPVSNVGKLEKSEV